MSEDVKIEKDGDPKPKLVVVYEYRVSQGTTRRASTTVDGRTDLEVVQSIQDQRKRDGLIVIRKPESTVAFPAREVVDVKISKVTQ